MAVKKKSSKTLTIPERIKKTRMATTNTLKEKNISEAVGRFGYTEAKINAGQKLALATDDLDAKQLKAHGIQQGAGQTLAKAEKVAKKTYATTLEIARVAFRGDKNARAALLLGGKRLTSTTGFFNQSSKMYRNILETPSYLAIIKDFGYTKTKIQAEFKLIKDVDRLDNVQERAKAAAQKATERRDKKLKQMDRWMMDFNRVAKKALANDRQSLEALGIVAKRKK